MKKAIGFIVCLFVGVIVGEALARFGGTAEPAIIIRSDTVVVERWDTMTIEKPTEVIRYVSRYDTVRTTELVVISDKLENGQIKPAAALIPIESVVYKDSTEDAQYTAYVSGYKAALDSISISCMQSEKIITVTERIPPRRISFGIQAGIGACKNGISPYVGIGVQYRIQTQKKP